MTKILSFATKAYACLVASSSIAYAFPNPTPQNIAISPISSPNGSFTVSWSKVNDDYYVAGSYTYSYSCIWMSIDITKGGQSYEYFETSNCNQTSVSFSGYPGGTYVVTVSAYVEESEEDDGNYEYNYDDVSYPAPSKQIVVNLPEPEPQPPSAPIGPIYPPSDPEPSNTGNRRVVFIHTDLLGSPAAETY